MKFHAKRTKENIVLHGKFLVLAFNSSFNYWVFGTLENTIDFRTTQIVGKLVERPNYEIFGLYRIQSVNPRDILITKDMKGNSCIMGGVINVNFEFDAWGTRKNAFYKAHCSNSDILSRILKYSGDSTKVIDYKEVKKYKSKSKWREHK